jgi:hypothetical protein
LISTLLKENRDLRSAVARGASENDSLPISEVLTDIPGSFQKSKFFGQSHWMNALEPVSSHPITYYSHTDISSTTPWGIHTRLSTRLQTASRSTNPQNCTKPSTNSRLWRAF